MKKSYITPNIRTIYLQSFHFCEVSNGRFLYLNDAGSREDHFFDDDDDE